MATSSQGLTVSWDGTNLLEPSNLSASGASAQVVDVTGRDTGRHKIFEGGDVDMGSVSVEAFVDSLGASSLGIKGTLVISGGGVSFAGYAVFEAIEFACSVGAATRFNYRFRLSGPAL